jgi:hypothetical protein
MQQGSPKRNPESKAAFESNQKMAILEFARISKSQVFPSLIAVNQTAPCLGSKMNHTEQLPSSKNFLLPPR